MTSRWILLLTDDPSIAGPIARLAESVGLMVRPGHELGAVAADPPGYGPPALVVLGTDWIPESLPPAAGVGVPRVLVSAGEPEGRFWRSGPALRAEQVVLLPEGEPVLLDRLTRLAGRSDRRSLVIAVSGGCGGAGTSVLAAGLARVATRVARSLLIEVDRMGSGADLLLGAEDEPGLRWPDLASARGRLLPGSLLGAVPVIDDLHVLSWDRSPDPVEVPAEAGAAVLETAVQEFGIVVLDLPRWLDAAAGVAARSADLALLVLPAQFRAVVAARRVVAGLQQHLADVRVVVRGPAPPALPAETVAEALGLPLAGLLKPEPGLREALDRGEPPGLRSRGPLATLCRQLLAGELVERGLEWGDAR